MVRRSVRFQAERMTNSTCCRRPMSTIEVTTGGATRLALHSCPGCGQHVWERGGEVVDRSAALSVVRDRIAEGPAPRVRAKRATRSRARV